MNMRAKSGIGVLFAALVLSSCSIFEEPTSEQILEQTPLEYLDERRAALEEVGCERGVLGNASPLSQDEFRGFYAAHDECLSAAYAAEREPRHVGLWQGEAPRDGDAAISRLGPPASSPLSEAQLAAERVCASLGPALARVAATPDLCAPRRELEEAADDVLRLIGLGRATVLLSRKAWREGNADAALTLAEHGVAALRDARRGASLLLDLSASIAAEGLIVNHLQTMFAGEFELDAHAWSRHRAAFALLASASPKPGTMLSYDGLRVLQSQYEGVDPSAPAVDAEYRSEFLAPRCPDLSAGECFASWEPHEVRALASPARATFDEMMSEHLEALRNYIERAATSDLRWSAAQTLLDHVAARNDAASDETRVLIPIGPIDGGRTEPNGSALQFYPQPLEAVSVETLAPAHE